MAHSSRAEIEHWKRTFEATAHQPESWLMHAQSLFWAGDVLLHRYHKSRALNWKSAKANERHLAKPHIVLMLLGMAIENLIKSVIVKRGLKVTKSGYLVKWFSSHDLVKLCDKASIPLNAEHTRLLRYLRIFIESGKYPIGNSPVNPFHERNEGRSGVIDIEADIASIQTFVLLAMTVAKATSAMSPEGE